MDEVTFLQSSGTELQHMAERFLVHFTRSCRAQLALSSHKIKETRPEIQFASQRAAPAVIMR
jgi:hypothetical protein